MIILKPLILDPTGWLEANWVDRTQAPDAEIPATETEPARTEPGAVTETQLKCVSYHPTQLDLLRADAAGMGTLLGEHEAVLAAWVAAYVPPPPTPAAEIAQGLRSALAAEYERRMQIIAAGYPPSERESWPVQTGEARALLADSGAATPWIDAAAAARSLDRLELAARIAAKDDAYRVIHGALTGARQRIEDAIDAAGDDAEALAAIDVAAGWPPAPV